MMPLPASSFDSYGALKLLPYWDPLRGEPCFEKIVASLAPKEPPHPGDPAPLLRRPSGDKG